MESGMIMSWFLAAGGLAGFFLAGKKVWWAWYVNLANQVLWTFYSFVTGQWGFLVATAFYFYVFGRNAYLWTKDHRNEVGDKDGSEVPGTGRHDQ